MEIFAILLGAWVIGDAILFVNGYRSSFFDAKTDLEKKVRQKFFEDKGIEWTYETENPPGFFARLFRKRK
jgi:hypothetical protein